MPWHGSCETVRCSTEKSHAETDELHTRSDLPSEEDCTADVACFRGPVLKRHSFTRPLRSLMKFKFVRKSRPSRRGEGRFLLCLE